MSAQNTETLLLILEKEADFEKEIRRLTALIESNRLTDVMIDYLAGLDDLKNDLLLPARKESFENEVPASSVIADKYWYLSRV
ncbi:MAG: hypothetical protein IKR09_01565 [Alphaproteobacteria bacterium]|nr:hypothetical protein [Alphaproteobacteria bacterium]